MRPAAPREETARCSRSETKLSAVWPSQRPEGPALRQRGRPLPPPALVGVNECVERPARVQAPDGGLARLSRIGSVASPNIIFAPPLPPHRVPCSRGMERTHLRRTISALGLLRGGAKDESRGVRAGVTARRPISYVRAIGCAENRAAKTRFFVRRIARDNCIYREQNVKSPLARARGRAARAAWPRIAGVRQLIDKKGFSGFSTPRAGPAPCERMRPTLAEYYSR